MAHRLGCFGFGRDSGFGDRPEGMKTKLPMTDAREERAKLIEHMLTGVEESLSERKRQNEFIESIRDQFDKVGWLTEGQYQGLEKFYDRI